LFSAARAILVALPLAGTLYQTLSVRSESGRFPPPCRLINVARPGEPERRLHLVCLGAGEPTVIFEANGFGGALSASVARQEVSLHTRVCSYDRMGMGWSDRGPASITAGLLADDLERLTMQAELRPPFILVPASIGGLPAELFARRHPEQVVGMVFVDAANSALHERFAPYVTRMEVEGACLLKGAAQLGVVRLMDPFHLRKDPSDDAALSMSRLYRVEPMSTLCGIARGLQTTTQEFSAAPPLAPDVPLIVLVHEKFEGFVPPGLAALGVLDAEQQMVKREWLMLQQRFAQRSSRGKWRVVPGSDHLMGSSHPHAVSSAVFEVLAEVQTAR